MTTHWILKNSINHLYNFLSHHIPINDREFYDTWYRHYLKILHLIDIPRGSSVLEVGLGFGIISLCLSAMGYNTFSLEHPSRDFLKQDFLEIFKKNNVKITYGDITTSLPFKSNTFDLISVCDVIEHLLPWNVPYLIEEIKRCLKKNGILILSTPNLCRTSNIIRFLTGRMINPPMTPEKFGTTYDHIREYTYREISFILRESGFDILNMEFGLIPYFDITKNNYIQTINRIISKIIFFFYKKYGDEVYIKCKKK